jgi:hypothetical protein
VVVPGAPGTAGFAAAAVAVARLRRPSRPALAVVDGPIDDATRETLEAVVPLGVAVPVETWDPAGDPLGPDEHLARLRAVVGAPRSRIVALACDPAQQAEIVDAAGEIVAWRETR